jgi:hypothetical protein
LDDRILIHFGRQPDQTAELLRVIGKHGQSFTGGLACAQRRHDFRDRAKRHEIAQALVDREQVGVDVATDLENETLFVGDGVVHFDLDPTGITTFLDNLFACEVAMVSINDKVLAISLVETAEQFLVHTGVLDGLGVFIHLLWLDGTVVVEFDLQHF